MDYLLSFFLLLISSVIGISFSHVIGIKSYLKIAIIIMFLFIPMELYNEFVLSKNSNSSKNLVPVHNSHANINYNTNPLLTNPLLTNPMTTSAAKFAREQDLQDTKYGIFKHKGPNGEDKDSLPLDGLDPSTLLSKLNYITYATSNPYKPLSYVDFKTNADKYLDKDGTKLSTDDKNLLRYSNAFYPQLTSNQIDATNCLNYGSGPKSCFQSPQLFFNVKNDFNILNKSVNENNSNLLIKEDFSNPMVLDTKSRYDPILFANAQKGNLDRILDNQSNESMQLDNSKSLLCLNCKLAVCKNNYCQYQNELFL